MTFAFVVFTLGAIAVYAGLNNKSLKDVLAGVLDPRPVSGQTPTMATAALTGGGGGGTPSLAGAAVPAGGDWGGSKAVVDRAVAIGQEFGLKVTSTKRATRATLSGGVSDHWTGNKNAYAADQSGSVAAMDQTAQAIAQAFGFQSWKGVQTIHVGGFRLQLLYRTMVGGDHFNHVHFGAKRES